MGSTLALLLQKQIRGSGLRGESFGASTCTELMNLVSPWPRTSAGCHAFVSLIWPKDCVVAVSTLKLAVEGCIS